MSSFPHYLQLDSMDCGPSCLRMIAKYYGRSYTLQTLRDLSFITREGVSMLGISDAAESIGMHTQGVRVTLEQLVNDIPLPCILHYNQNHFVVLYKIKGKSSRVQKLLGKANSDSHLSTPNFQFFIADPAGQKYVMDSGEFTRCWYSGKTNGKDIGTALLLSPSPDFYNYEDDRDKQKKKPWFLLPLPDSLQIAVRPNRFRDDHRQHLRAHFPIPNAVVDQGAIFKYPDVIPAPIILTGTTPPASIVARSSGKLKELLTEDNRKVRSGDYLAVIDNPASTEDVLKLKRFLDCFELSSYYDGGVDSLLDNKNLQLGALQAIFSTFYTVLFEYSEYRRLMYYPQKITMTLERIVQYEKQYNLLLSRQRITDEQFILAKKQYHRDSLLNIKEVISDEALEISKNDYLQSLLSRETMRSDLNSLQIQIGQLKESLLDTGQQDTEKLNGLQTQLQSIVSQLRIGIREWELNYVLCAPVDGTITFTNYWAENQNVSTGEEIFTIVPNDDSPVIGKAQLPIAHSGKVKTGQRVNIRLLNFPENEYGILQGVVGNISLVPVQTAEVIYYTVEIQLPNQLVTTYKKGLPYLPSMQGQADIVTEDISLLERFILPVKRILSENSL